AFCAFEAECLRPRGRYGAIVLLAEGRVSLSRTKAARTWWTAFRLPTLLMCSSAHTKYWMAVSLFSSRCAVIEMFVSDSVYFVIHALCIGRMRERFACWFKSEQCLFVTNVIAAKGAARLMVSTSLPPSQL